MKSSILWPAVWAAVILTGCSTDSDTGDEAPIEGYPPGTVAVGQNSFMVPLEEKDADGCQGYRLVAPGRLTIQAIHYRRPDGSFSVNKLEADCQRD